MKLRKHSAAVAFLVLFVAAASDAAARQKSDEPLTNASVVKLVRAGFHEKTVASIIGARPVNFDLSPDALIELKKNGVSERIIVAMIAREQSGFFSDPDLDDEGFFGRGDSKAGGAGGAGQSAAADPNSVNVFGSSGGSRGQTRSRGGSSGVDTDTETVGSATARIVRPRRESGGATAPRLERATTLTNEGVIQLVEGGFTEGTIIRRIEQSPVEFDLSPAKLAELRKRRVSEPVIAAMKAAMEEGPEGQPRR